MRNAGRKIGNNLKTRAAGHATMRARAIATRVPHPLRRSVRRITQSIWNFAEAANYSSLKMYGRFLLHVEAKMRENRRRLVASCTNLRLNK